VNLQIDTINDPDRAPILDERQAQVPGMQQHLSPAQSAPQFKSEI
jgi:hypothetical protein